MGLSIHYSGRFNPAASLKAMIEEVKDIATIYKWDYFVFDNEFPTDSLGKTIYNQQIYGICFTPPECETVDLCFLYVPAGFSPEQFPKFKTGMLRNPDV